MKKGKLKRFVKSILVATFLSFIPWVARAQWVAPPITFLPAGTGLGQILWRVTDWLLIVAGSIVVIYLIYSGLQYITSAGNAEKAAAGKNGIINAIIGIVIILVALLVVNWVSNILRTGQTGCGDHFCDPSTETHANCPQDCP